MATSANKIPRQAAPKKTAQRKKSTPVNSVESEEQSPSPKISSGQRIIKNTLIVGYTIPSIVLMSHSLILKA